MQLAATAKGALAAPSARLPRLKPAPQAVILRTQAARRSHRRSEVSCSVAVASGVAVKFSIPYQTRWGEHLAIVGSHDRLGHWDANYGVKMEWSEGNVWRAELEIPAGDHEYEVEYKYVIRKGDWVEAWKPGHNYVLRVPAHGGPAVVQVEDTWESQVKVEVEGSDDEYSANGASHVNGHAVNGHSGATLRLKERAAEALRADRASRARSASPSSASANGSAANFSPEQLAFLERKRASSASPAPASGRGRSPVRSNSQYTPEQLAFLERKKREASPRPAAAAAPARGRSPTRAVQAAPAQSLVTPQEAASLSKEQQEFLARKRSASPAAQRDSPVQTPTARSSSPRPAFRARPAAASPAQPRASAGESAKYTPEQLAFLERKRSESPRPAQQPRSAAAGGSAAQYTPEQLAFLERRKKEGGSRW